MSDAMYPAEPPVDLRSTRKIAPPTPKPEPEPENIPPDTEAWAPAESEQSYQDEPWDEGDDDEGGDDGAPAATSTAWHEELLPTPPGAETDPAKWGRRGWFNTVSGGALKLRPLPEEVLHRRAVAAVGQNLIGQNLIMVANPDGGQAKTVTSLMLANTFATYRRTSPPVVWDNNESEGTLGLRATSSVPATSVWDLLEHYDTLAAPHAAASGLSQFLRVQPTGAEVLASDDSDEGLDQIAGEDCERIYSVLCRWRELVIVDTGNNRRRSNWLWTAQHAHALVIPIVYALDSTVVALKMIEALKRLGREDLTANAIVVCAPNPGGPNADLRDQIHKTLKKVGVRRIEDVPFEPTLPAGGRIDYERVSEETRRAWVQVAAIVTTVLAESAPYRRVELTVDGPPSSYPDTAEDRRRGAQFEGLRSPVYPQLEQNLRLQPDPDRNDRRYLA